MGTATYFRGRKPVCVPIFVVLALAGCKSRPQPTLPQIPDSNQVAGGGNTELPNAMIFHTILKYAGHASQAIVFYQAEMHQRKMALFARALEDGAIRSDVTIDDFSSLMFGIMHAMAAGGNPEVLMDVVLAGLRVPSSCPDGAAKRLASPGAGSCPEAGS